MSHNKNFEEDKMIEQVEMPTKDEVEEIETSIQYGVVTDCLKLNVRETPDKAANVLAIVNCLDELQVNLKDSTDDWYAVCTSSGIEGFCMKPFVAIRQ